MTTFGFGLRLRRRWLAGAAVCALATSACGATDDEVVELDDPGQSAAATFGAFADRYSPCGEEIDQVGPSLLESVQTWSVLRSSLSDRSSVRRSLQFDARVADVEQGSTSLVVARLEAHQSMVEGLELGMSTPKAKVVLGLIPEGDIDYVQVALIVLPDGLVLAPGDCMTASLFGRDASPVRQQEVSAFLRSVVGATGEDLRRRVSEFDQGATTPADQVEQVLPGSGSASERDAIQNGASTTMVSLRWPESWIGSGILCVRTSVGVGACESMDGPPSGEPLAVFVDGNKDETVSILHAVDGAPISTINNEIAQVRLASQLALSPRGLTSVKLTGTGPSAPGRTTVQTCDVAELERSGKALDECN